MGRILCIDYGSKRIGTALSDPGKTIASPFKTLDFKSEEILISEIASLIEEYDVEMLVIGYPIGMKGQKTLQTKITEKFVETLKSSISLPIVWIDERLSSVEAERALRSQGIKPSRHKAMIDTTAAALILQTYLDSRLYR